MTFKITVSFNGTAMRDARIARKMTTRDLAELLGVNSAQITRWENGKTKPNRKHLPKMAKVLKLKVRDLDGQVSA